MHAGPCREHSWESSRDTVESDLRRRLADHQLDPETERAIRLLLDPLYTASIPSRIRWPIERG